MNFFKKLQEKIRNIFKPKKKQQNKGGGSKTKPIAVSPIKTQTNKNISVSKQYQKKDKEPKTVNKNKQPKNRREYGEYASYLNKRFSQEYDKQINMFRNGDLSTRPEFVFLTAKDIKEYIKEYEKSRNKYYRDVKRQKEKGDVLLPLKFSGNLKNLTSYDQFTQRLENMKHYNAKGATLEFNSWVRDNCRENISIAFGKFGKELNDLIDGMTDSQYYIFFKENKELEALAYGSPKSVEEYINMTLLNYNNILSRLTKFLGEK